jgi:hypothetical protein
VDPVDPDPDSDPDSEHWNIPYHSYRTQSSEFKVRYLRDCVTRLIFFLLLSGWTSPQESRRSLLTW